jgi:hypothetical protein
MLNRTTISTPLPRVALGTIRKNLFAGPYAWLAQVVAIFVIGCLLACVYLWQSSAISDIQDQTQQIEVESGQLEHDNVALMLQVAQWNQPDYIAGKARQLGLVAGQTPVVMKIPLTTHAPQAANTVFDNVAGLWQQLMERMPGASTVMVQAAAWIR